MKKILLISFIIIAAFGCRKSTPTEVTQISVEVSEILKTIKEVEHKNLNELIKAAKKLKQIGNNPKAQLLGDYYLIKADFLYFCSSKSAQDLENIYEKLKKEKEYKLLAEIDILLTTHYYANASYKEASKRIEKSFDYCFENHLYLERQALIYGLSPSSSLLPNDSRKEEILEVIHSIKGLKWDFFHSTIHIGLIKTLYYLEQYKEAEKLAFAVIEKNKQANYTLEIAKCYEVLAGIYRADKRDYTNTLAMHHKSIEYLKQFGSIDLALAYRMIGHTFANEKLFKEAYDAYEQAIHYGKMTNDSASLSVDYAYLGWVYFKQDTSKNYEVANQYFEKAIAYSKGEGAAYRLVLQRRMWALSAIGKKKEAEALNTKVLAVENKMLLNKSDSKLKEFQINYIMRFRSKDLRVQTLEAQNELQDAKLKQQRLTSWALIAFASMFCGLVALLFTIRKQLKKIKEKEQQLTVMVSELNDKNALIENKNEQLENLVEQISESNKNLENFAYVAAHDIEAPLRSIGSFSAMLHKRLEDKINSAEEEMFFFIINGCQSLKEIVTGLLNFSKIPHIEETGELKPVNLNNIFKNVTDLLFEKLKEKEGHIIIQENFPKVLGKESLLKQLFLNLINNAIKFSRKGIPPAISINFEMHANSYVAIMIKDNGFGIPENAQKEIFQLFKRFVSSKEYDGAGIGLATCKKIVNYHKGKIYVSETGEKGTTFAIELQTANTSLIQ